MEPDGAPVAHPKSMPQWLLEGIFIVISVVLGFGVSQCGQYRADRELARRALTSISAEIDSNRKALEPLAPLHKTWTAALAKADTTNGSQAALDVYFALRPPLPAGSTPFPVLRRSAWDAALAGGALRLVDYDVVMSLSEIYRTQEIATENVQRLANGALSTPETFDPAHRAAAIRLLWLTLADIEAAEAVLLDLYRQRLPAIQATAR